MQDNTNLKKENEDSTRSESSFIEFAPLDGKIQSFNKSLINTNLNHAPINMFKEFNKTNQILTPPELNVLPNIPTIALLSSLDLFNTDAFINKKSNVLLDKFNSIDPNALKVLNLFNVPEEISKLLFKNLIGFTLKNADTLI